MEYKEIIIEAIGTLTVNKLRTSLAILGIVIGIGSVIALISLGESSKQAVQSQIQSIGANLLTISPGGQNTGAVRGAAGGGTTLTLEDSNAIESNFDQQLIKSVSPEYAGRSQVVAGRNNTNTQIIGVVPIYSEMRKISLTLGAFISEGHVLATSKVAVLGPTVVENLFDVDTNPVGQSIRINGQTFQVIGVTETKGGTGFQNQDDRIYVPLTSAQKLLFGVKHLTSIALEVTREDQMVDAQNQVGYFLLTRHKISTPAEKDFTIISQQDILDTATSVAGTFTTMLSGVAAISLLVGGIGIMNIMLVTVTERTREIGLRKALGAKKKVIITQFLVESVILTFSGGIIGILFGVLGFFVYTRLANSSFIVSPLSVLLAFAVSAGIGVLFGWYPAKKAANLQPIEALRYE